MTKPSKWGARRAKIGKQTRWIRAIGDQMPDEVEFLKRLYDRFNAFRLEKGLVQRFDIRST